MSEPKPKTVEVQGCGSCPFHSYHCCPHCALDKDGSVGDIYDYEEAVPPACPLRAAPLLVRLGAEK